MDPSRHLDEVRTESSPKNSPWDLNQKARLMEFNPPPRLQPFLWLAVVSVLVLATTWAKANDVIRLDYVHVSHDLALSATERHQLMAPWKAEIDKNNREFPYAPSVSKATGHAPAYLLVGRSGSMTVTILSSLSTCENTGSTSVEPLCAAKIILEEKTIATRSCFVEAIFDPRPGENTSNTYSMFSVDTARRTVTLNATRKGRPVPRCRRIVRY